MARELVLIALAAACGRDKPATSELATPPLASAAFYRIDPGPRTPCAIATTCEARLVLTALGDYHVNAAYPFKFVADPVPALQPAGEATFALDDAKNGTLTIRFRPRHPGTAKLVGTVKLSVCTDDVCEIETPRIELAVPVS